MNTSEKKENLIAWCFVLPFLFFFLGFLLYPILKGMNLSLYDATLGGKTSFVGIENYIKMFGDKGFWQAMFNTLFFVLISTPAIVLVGFTFAMFINSKLKGTTFIRACLFSPYVLSMSVVTGLWVFIFQPYTGLVTQLTKVLGVGELYWLNTKWLVWIAVLITTVWWTVGFNMILFLAGLQDIPTDIYEASRIDGANARQILFMITIPMLRDTIALVIMLQTIASFKLFGQTYLMAGGGPGTHTRTIVHYIYETGFTNRRMGSAAAMSFAFFIVVFAITMLQNKILGKKDK
ncbi:carbohydrate ABC transporter permease [Kineothrix sp. MB12-C1]|uniref:carbohydrate ABC transporter permease n=1 Tax=Kineothrix sp. MB12-C1 TaxID=3070215 RepID=UPI0027D1F67E|nr:sugar ABC transporter permease [Kineothrix sp. MB12-C1]WMC91444.1 sugar ABC transporter permease [Kineothrix sp. MB12-C1]